MSFSSNNYLLKQTVYYKNVSILHTVPPEPPLLSVVTTQVDSLHLQWNSKKNGGSPILGM